MTAKFSLKDFYAQTIKKFVGEIPDLIESHRSTKKVLRKPKSLKCNAEDLPLMKVRQSTIGNSCA